jgi:two-component system response regulator HydG
MPPAKVLVVSDASTAVVVRSALGSAYACEVASSGDAGLAAIGRGHIDVVVSDDIDDDMRGLDLLGALQRRSPAVPVILLGGAGDVERATEAGRRGVFEYVAKPVDAVALSRSVERALEARRQPPDVRSHSAADAPRATVIGSSERFTAALQEIECVAHSSAPVLLVGETGTGKDRLAARIHAFGPRRHRPFVVVNAAALPATLLDSELFGHVAGSFTGATRARRGLIAEADGGTLFLDEIADLPIELQGRLLRVIETGAVRPVGAVHERTVDVRFVAATHCALASAVAENRFRQDLFYRLNVLAVHVPPLRERSEDLPELIAHFLERAIAKTPRSPVTELAPEASDRLLGASWPGNVRELSAYIERLVVFGRRSRIELADLEALDDGTGPSWHGSPAPPRSSKATLSLREVSRRHVDHVLIETGGDKTKAAEILGVDVSTLYRWIRREAG